jgi:peroxiredoxin
MPGQFNKALSPGDPAPAWDGLECTDGKTHALADLKADVVVVVFTCNSCPVAVGYEDRLIAFAKAAGDGVQVVAINPNAVPEDKLPAMKQRAEKKRFPFLYLADPAGAVAKKYGAQYTPEFVVLDKSRKVVYLGAMDEKSPPAAGGTPYLEQAVAAAKTGAKPATAETLARGCRIRWARPDR